jgi:hypothetical protein
MRLRADHRYCPSIDVSSERPLPHGFPYFGPEVPTSNRVPSVWFLTTSTGSSARRSAGLLHPAADPGVRRVSRVCRHVHRVSSGMVESAAFLYGVVRTPRRIPLISSRTMSPWPLPPCRSPSAHPALLPVTVASPEFVRIRVKFVDFEALLRR